MALGANAMRPHPPLDAPPLRRLGLAIPPLPPGEPPPPPPIDWAIELFDRSIADEELAHQDLRDHVSRAHCMLIDPSARATSATRSHGFVERLRRLQPLAVRLAADRDARVSFRRRRRRRLRSAGICGPPPASSSSSSSSSSPSALSLAEARNSARALSASRECSAEFSALGAVWV